MSGFSHVPLALSLVALLVVGSPLATALGAGAVAPPLAASRLRRTGLSALAAARSPARLPALTACAGEGAGVAGCAAAATEVEAEAAVGVDADATGRGTSDSARAGSWAATGCVSRRSTSSLGLAAPPGARMAVTLYVMPSTRPKIAPDMTAMRTGSRRNSGKVVPARLSTRALESLNDA